ncbi:MAG: FAD-dependent oxidoreductase [Fimbriimonadaceae bacterium]|nr:FAD-dependent oxidoreductase [Fimbriimonadaceae bacterium]
MPEYDVLIAGGGTGGCAAAMALCDLGKRVLMTEEAAWIGGQLTAQAVPPDEHPWIEVTGCTARYRRYRDLVREHYRDFTPLTLSSRKDARLNPGGGWVSRLCHEPKVGLGVLYRMLSPYLASGHLTIRCRTRVVALGTRGDRIEGATVRDLRTGEESEVGFRTVLDATETGDLLPMGGVEYVTGAESKRETGEPHALDGDADPTDMQGITWCFAMSVEEGADHTIDKPAHYERWRAYRPEFWPGPLLGWVTSHPHTLVETTWSLHPRPDMSLGLFDYRQVVRKDAFLPGTVALDATIVNWPQNDYFVGPILDVPEGLARERLEDSRQLSLSLLYWLQTEAPRLDGGVGYPGAHLRPDLTGTRDGLAMTPYIRESRRIRAAFTVTELHVGSGCLPGRDRAPGFADSVGVGCYRCDLHPSTSGRNSIDIGALPFEIPLGVLVPQRVENLIPAAKNVGTTHISNGCFRLHPVEWNLGEAAGILAAYCLDAGVPPQDVHASPDRVREVQAVCDRQGVQRAWPELRPV